MALSKAEKLKRCAGCQENFYNGNNPLGVNECWGLETAKSVERTMVGVWQNPPYVWNPQKTLSCHRPKGSVWLPRTYSTMCATPEAAAAMRKRWDEEEAARKAAADGGQETNV